MQDDAACGESTVLDEADHRIANHLALLASYVRLKGREIAKRSEEPDRASVRLLLEGIGVQIQAVSRLHRALAAERPEVAADLGQHLHELCVSFRSALFGGTELIEEIETGIDVPVEQILPLTQIFAEVITNSIKHGHAGRDAGEIHIRCRREPKGAVLLEVVDDGTGLSAAFDPFESKGLGFRLVRALSEQIGGVMTFEGGAPGLCFRLLLPPILPADGKSP